jgi:1-deoxy-D-xylulose-5-phosphate synthase
LEFQAAHGYGGQVRILGIPDHIVEHGTLRELQHECGYDAPAIVAAVREMTGETVSVKDLLG